MHSTNTTLDRERQLLQEKSEQLVDSTHMPHLVSDSWNRRTCTFKRYIIINYAVYHKKYNLPCISISWHASPRQRKWRINTSRTIKCKLRQLSFTLFPIQLCISKDIVHENFIRSQVSHTLKLGVWTSRLKQTRVYSRNTHLTFMVFKLVHLQTKLKVGSSLFSISCLFEFGSFKLKKLVYQTCLWTSSKSFMNKCIIKNHVYQSLSFKEKWPVFHW